MAQRAFGTHWTVLLVASLQFLEEDLFVVARLPSSMPVPAKIHEPVQTLRT